MNPILLLKAGAIVIAIAIVFFTGQRIERLSWVERENEIKEQTLRELAYHQTRGDEMTRQFAESQATLNKLKLNSNERSLNEISKNSGDYACRIPDGGLRLITSAVREANAAK